MDPHAHTFSLDDFDVSGPRGVVNRHTEEWTHTLRSEQPDLGNYVGIVHSHRTLRFQIVAAGIVVGRHASAVGYEPRYDVYITGVDTKALLDRCFDPRVGCIYPCKTGVFRGLQSRVLVLPKVDPQTIPAFRFEGEMKREVNSWLREALARRKREARDSVSPPKVKQPRLSSDDGEPEPCEIDVKSEGREPADAPFSPPPITPYQLANMPHIPDDEILLNVGFHQASQHWIVCKTTETVEELRDRMARRTGAPKDQILIVYKGLQLDNCGLAQYFSGGCVYSLCLVLA